MLTDSQGLGASRYSSRPHSAIENAFQKATYCAIENAIVRCVIGGSPAMDNVIELPRPRELRAREASLALAIRVGRNDHKEILELIAAGERGIFGFVIEAPNVDRHKELITEVRKR